MPKKILNISLQFQSLTPLASISNLSQIFILQKKIRNLPSQWNFTMTNQCAHFQDKKNSIYTNWPSTNMHLHPPRVITNRILKAISQHSGQFENIPSDHKQALTLFYCFSKFINNEGVFYLMAQYVLGSIRYFTFELLLQCTNAWHPSPECQALIHHKLEIKGEFREGVSG